MPKIKNKKLGFFRKIHLGALLTLAVYLILSKLIFVRAMVDKNVINSFLWPFIFGSFATIIFLYLFSHEDFFHFISDLEKKEEPKEKTLLKRYYHHGKVMTTILVGTFGGPIFAALTARLLIPRFRYKYLVVIISVALSTISGMGVAKGLFTALH